MVYAIGYSLLRGYSRRCINLITKRGLYEDAVQRALRGMDASISQRFRRYIIAVHPDKFHTDNEKRVHNELQLARLNQFLDKVARLSTNSSISNSLEEMTVTFHAHPPYDTFSSMILRPPRINSKNAAVDGYGPRLIDDVYYQILFAADDVKGLEIPEGHLRRVPDSIVTSIAARQKAEAEARKRKQFQKLRRKQEIEAMQLTKPDDNFAAAAANFDYGGAFDSSTDKTASTSVDIPVPLMDANEFFRRKHQSRLLRRGVNLDRLPQRVRDPLAHCKEIHEIFREDVSSRAMKGISSLSRFEYLLESDMIFFSDRLDTDQQRIGIAILRRHLKNVASEDWTNVPILLSDAFELDPPGVLIIPFNCSFEHFLEHLKKHLHSICRSRNDIVGQRMLK